MGLWLIILLTFFKFHDFHTSLSEINYNPKTTSLEISIRVFNDDFESVLSKASARKISFEEPESVLNPIIEKYLKKNIALISPNKEVKLINYIGKEKEGEALWVFVELENCSQIKGYTLLNSILQDQFADQSNLVNIIYPSQKKTLLFDAKNKAKLWPF